jgi:alpha-tubulin suppressor-like RCC1 family protein
MLTSNNLIYSVGSNSEGQLGIGDMDVLEKNAPVLIESLVVHRPSQVACGQEHSASVMENGELYTWGRGKRGALGNRKSLSCYEPRHVTFAEATGIKQVSCGRDHTLAIEAEEGFVYGFGANSHGQLGVGSKEDVFAPT